MLFSSVIDAVLTNNTQEATRKDISQRPKGKAGNDDDDPSMRPFDREKDIGTSKISNSQRREMMNRASDFGSRFSGGKML